MSKKIRLTLAYDGSMYKGWQIQPDVSTVQGELEKAVARIFKEKIRVEGAGRTDSGAHAVSYVAHFSANRVFLPVLKIPLALNSVLPQDIRVFDAREVPDGFHARFSASAREYVYIIHEASHPLPQFLRYTYFYNAHPSEKRLKEASSLFVGEHDFKNFCYGYPDLEERDTIRKIFYFRVRRFGPFLLFFIKGSGFLQGMIRTLVAVSLNYAEGKLSLSLLREALQRKIRLENRYRVAVPARGLYFKRAYY